MPPRPHQIVNTGNVRTTTLFSFLQNGGRYARASETAAARTATGTAWTHGGDDAKPRSWRGELSRQWTVEREGRNHYRFGLRDWPCRCHRVRTRRCRCVDLLS